MSLRIGTSLGIFGLVFAVIPISATAAPSRSVFSVRSSVPTICRIDFAEPLAAAVQAGVVTLGSFTEFCNRADGYRVILRHAAGLQAAIEIDGAVVPLSTGEETTIVDSDLPVYRTGVARIVIADGSTLRGDLAFRVEPKGPGF